MSSLYYIVDERDVPHEGTPFTADGSREYKKVFLVKTLVKEAGPLVICNAPGIPLPFAPYISESGTEYDLLAVMVKKSARQIENDWSTWEVTCEYSTNVPEGGIPEDFGYPDSWGGSSNNPQLEPADIEFDMQEVQRPLSRALGGFAITNSAKQPFSPSPTFDFAYPVLQISRNELEFDIAKATAYAFAVNSDSFFGVPPGSAQCLPPKAKLQFRGTLRFWRVTYRIRFNLYDSVAAEWISWQPEILDQGLCRIDTNAASPTFNQPIPIIRKAMPVTQPVLLDGNGQPLTLPADGIYLPFTVYNSLSFNDLIVNGLG